MHGTVKTYNLRQAAHKWGDNHNCRVTRPRERERERGSRPTAGSPSRDSSPGRRAPRTSGLPFRRARGLWEIGTPLLECTQNPTCPKSQHMGSDLKGAWSNFLPNLGEPPRGTGGLLVGTQMLVAAIWGNLFDHKDAGADKHHLGVPPTPRLPSALSPPADWHQLCSCIPGLACQHTESSWPCHHRRPMQPTEEAPYTV